MEKAKNCQDSKLSIIIMIITLNVNDLKYWVKFNYQIWLKGSCNYMKHISIIETQLY